MMNEKQILAAKVVERALIRAGKAGLNGGVYEGCFCFWPAEKDIHNYIVDGGVEFFNRVEEKGMLLYIPGMSLDGGAGV